MPSVPDRQAEFPDVPNWHNIRTGELSAWKRFADGHGIYYPQGATRSRIATNVRSWLERREAGASLPSVPNWIAKAVIVTPSYGIQDAAVTPIVAWRATKTQVIVRTTPTGRERRFYLDDLTEVGDPRSFRDLRIHLEPPDAPTVIGARQQRITDDARNSVLGAIEQQRLQDGDQSAEDVALKLTAIQDAITAALGALAEVL